MCRPTRLPYRGRLKWRGALSEDYAQLLHRGIGGSMYTRKPLQPNLERVNEAARIEPPQVLSEEPTAVTPHGGFCGGESQQWLSYPTNLPVRFDERDVETEPWWNH